MYRQYLLTTVGETQLVCWLEHDRKLKPGTKLTLKDMPGLWTVRESYSITLPDPPLVKWQVGGLS